MHTDEAMHAVHAVFVRAVVELHISLYPPTGVYRKALQECVIAKTRGALKKTKATATVPIWKATDYKESRL